MDLRRCRLAKITDTAAVLSRQLSPLVACDLEGRVQYVVSGRRTYHRGLSGILVEKGPSPGGRGHQLRRVPSREGRFILAAAMETVDDVLQSAAGREDVVFQGEGDDEAVRERLLEWGKTRSIWTPADLEDDAARYGEVYSPVSVLPPDQYRAVVLQAVTGCPWNDCGFCELYGGIRYRVPDLPDFEDHVRRVAAYLGRGLSHRSSVFLGDASLSRLSVEAIAVRCKAARRVLGDALPGRDWSFHAFADAFTPEAWTVDGLRGLAELGLRRFHIGVETGCAELLERVRKPHTAEKIRRLAGRLREGGIGVGLIFLVGLGGIEYAERHIHETARLVESLPLTSQDILYLSPLLPGQPVRYAEGPPVTPLDARGVQEQEGQLRDRLDPVRRRQGFRVATYDLRMFTY